MSDLVFRTTSTDRTVSEAVIEAARASTAWAAIAVEDPVTGALTYRKRLLRRRASSARKLMPLAPEGKRGRRDAAERQRRRGDAARR